MADLENIVQGEYGKTITLVLQDSDGNAQDVSSYDGDKTLIFRAPRNLKTITSTCDFTTTGSDGSLDFTFDSDTNPDVAGEWECQGELNNSGGTLFAKTRVFTMAVEKALR